MSNAEENESLKDALKSYGLKQDIRRIHAEMMPGLRGAKRAKAPVRSMYGMIRNIAAAILVLIVGTAVFVYYTSTPENLFNSRFAPYENSPQRGEGETASVLKEKFMEGQSFLKSGEPQKAVAAFSQILNLNRNSANKIMNDDAEYYLALAYLKNGEAEKALPLLERIHNNPGHLYNDQVTTWYLMKVRIAAWKGK
ncbi:MAG: tetratricopeptide repeat protein [Chitinophagaceae bacterium]|nr:tetratricopeptide repeat protein [Chitinophagaceae bacterium]